MGMPFGQLRRYLTEEFGQEHCVCVLASADAQGRPSARCMVLRHLADDGAMLFVSDRRSRKDDELRGRPDCELVFWLPRQNTQIRVRGEAAIVDAEGDTFMRQHWWEQLDARAVRIMTRSAQTDADATAMPATMELITVHPASVMIDDYRTPEPTTIRWSR